MITAVDTSALLAIYKGEADGVQWFEILQNQRRSGRLIACEVVVAEMGALFANEREALDFLEDLGVEYDSVQIGAAILAGQIFKAYRRGGGPREHLIPDFLIGAHALRQAAGLAAADKGYLRRYFPKLKLLTPPSHE